MSPAERYRQMALELKAKAAGESDVHLRAEWENLAAAYLRLAEQAERNASLGDLMGGPPENPDALPDQ